MVVQKKIEKIVAFFIVLILFIVGVSVFSVKTNNVFQVAHLPTPTPTPDVPFGSYHPPTISRKDFYRIAMVGDSMTAALGPHGGKLSEVLNALYKSTPAHQKILIDNYAQGSTNILDISGQMTKKITIGDVVFDPLLSRQFDILLIESFGYNPLSQFSLQDGLAKQAKILDQTMKLLTKDHPQMLIIFVATIAPNRETYAQEEVQLSVADRTIEANERDAYIKNHIDFAKAHNIPLIDMYDASILSNGDGNILYISPTDHIHPSFAGIDFIDQHISDFIYTNHILPQ